MNRFRQFAYKVSKNHTRTCWVLKCDTRKFFASIDQETINDIVSRYIPNKRIVGLIAEVVGSFPSVPSQCLDTPIGLSKRSDRRGLPLGNLTSQLLVNVYMNEFDGFVKHQLKAKYYIRYADNFVILSISRRHLDILSVSIGDFLNRRLHLDLRPDPSSPKATKGRSKVSIKTSASGVDFLGWVHFPDHRVLRSATRRRMFRNLDYDASDARVASYLGMLSQGNAWRLTQQVNVDRGRRA